MKAGHETEASLGPNGAQEHHDQDEVDTEAGEGEEDTLEHAVPYHEATTPTDKGVDVVGLLRHEVYVLDFPPGTPGGPSKCPQIV